MALKLIEQAQRRLNGDEVVDSEIVKSVVEEAESPQPSAGPPDSPYALLTLLIVPVAGYLVGSLGPNARRAPGHDQAQLEKAVRI